LYPHSQKLAVGERVPGYSRYMSGYSGDCSRTFWVETRRLHRWWKGTRILRVYVQILRTLFPDILDRNPQTPVLTETLSKFHFEVVFVAHKYLYGFSWAPVLSQNLQIKVPLDSTGFLYSKTKQKSTLRVNFNHHFFISFWRVVLHHLFCLFNFSTYTHAR
jgi:hypothetical protein